MSNNSYVSYNVIDENPEGDSEALLKAADKKKKAAARSSNASKDPLTKKRRKASPKKSLAGGDGDGGVDSDDADESDDWIHDVMTTEATAKRKPVAKKKAAAQLESGSQTQVKQKSKAKAKVKSKVKAKSRAKKAAVESEAQGLLTKGVHAGLRGLDGLHHQAQAMTLSAWIGLAASVLFMALSMYAWFRAPVAPVMEYHLKSFHLQSAHPESRAELPLSLWRKYVAQYPQLRTWCIKAQHKGEIHVLREPNAEELTHFIEYLEKQRCIARVHSISMGYIDQDIDKRALLCDLELRVPAMKIIMADGKAAWVDKQGVHLPGILPVPERYESRPRIHNINNQDDALMEVLSFWPLLETEIEEGLIVSIDLNDILQRSLNGEALQRGIVLKTKQGTRILWGRAGDSRYGMTAENKIQELVRSLRSQGDLRQTKVIDVRHTQPKYILARGPHS